MHFSPFGKTGLLSPFPVRSAFLLGCKFFLVFLQMGGKLSPFCTRCPNVGAALWKFRTLSNSLLQQAWNGDVDFQDLALDPGHEIFWCNKMPLSRIFSDSVGLPLQWSIEEVCAQIVKKHTQVAAERNLKFRNHLLSTAELLQLLPDHVPAITLDPLAPNWVSKLGLQ